MNKEILRKEYKRIRDDIPNKKELSEKIVHRLIQEEYYKNAKVIALYSSILSEVETEELFDICIKDKKRVVYPKVINDTTMCFYEVKSLEELNVGKFNIKEPITTKKVDKNEINLMIIPGLCFDKKKNRIGYGKGYYDNYLRNATCIKVALAYNIQLREKISISDNDIKMDYIITEDNIL